jgi:GNAT superfamily N-acetyltransferase
MIHVEDEPGMAVDLNALNESIQRSSRLIIQRVTTQEQLRQWVQVWGYGAPDEVTSIVLHTYAQLPLDTQSSLQFFLGTLDDKAVATSALFLGAGVASVKHVVTLHQTRRQGIGAAITLFTAQEARRQGYRVGVLTASPMGIAIYRRLGFQEYCTFGTYETAE